MTHISPGGEAMPLPPASHRRRTSIRPSPSLPGVPHPFSATTLLTLQINLRRARLAELEAEMIAACETAVLGVRPPTGKISDREHWDWAMWQRYLDAAARLEPEYGPAMRRLLQEIHQLERLMALPLAWGNAPADLDRMEVRTSTNQRTT